MEENSLGKSYMAYDWSNQLKGLAIILLLIGHLRLVRFSGAWAVSIFLIVSGFGLTQSYFKSGLNNFFEKRISKILFPYFFVTLLWVIIDAFLLRINILISDIALSLLGINPKCIFDLSMWYVTFILAWYAVFYFVFRFVKNNAIRIIVLFCFSMIFSYYSNIFPAELGVARYVLEFPIGVLLGLNFKRIINIEKSKVLNIQSILSVTFFILFYYLYENTPTPTTELLQCVCFGISIISLFSTLSIYSVRLKFLEFFGSISYEIYLFEYMFIERYKFIFNLQMDPWIKLSVYFIFVIGLAVLYKSLIMVIKNLLNRRNMNRLITQ